MLLSSLRFLSSAFAAVGIVALVMALSAITPSAIAAEPLTAAGCDNCGALDQFGNDCKNNNQVCPETDLPCPSCICVPNNSNTATYCDPNI